MKIGLFFGSFNPIHNGHLIIANFLRETTALEQVWLVVTPHNPLKTQQSLLPEYDRLHLVQLAIEGNPHLRASDIEFRLPRPSYTIDTLIHLREKYPSHDFSLIMGGDNIATIHKWKNYELLLRDYPIYVYHRAGYEVPSGAATAGMIHSEDVPMLDISATFIRSHLQQGHSMQYLLPDRVWEYIRDYKLYI